MLAADRRLSRPSQGPRVDRSGDLAMRCPARTWRGGRGVRVRCTYPRYYYVVGAQGSTTYYVGSVGSYPTGWLGLRSRNVRMPQLPMLVACTERSIQPTTPCRRVGRSFALAGIPDVGRIGVCPLAPGCEDQALICLLAVQWYWWLFNFRSASPA